MARSISGTKVTLNVSGSYINTLTDGTLTTIGHPQLGFSAILTSGIGDNQANRIWQSTGRTLVNFARETFNLNDMDGTTNIGAGAGNDSLGQTVDFEEIVGIFITNDNAVTADGLLEIIPDPDTNGWTPIGEHDVANGGALSGGGVLAKFAPAEAGFDVNPGTSENIRFRASGGDVTYSIYVIARNDDNESSSSSSSSISTSSSSVSSLSGESSSSSSSISTSSSSSSQST